MQLGPTSAHLPQRAGGLIQSHLLHLPSIASCSAVDMWQQVFDGKHPALPELQAASFRRGRRATSSRKVLEPKKDGNGSAAGDGLDCAVINDQCVKDNFKPRITCHSPCDSRRKDRVISIVPSILQFSSSISSAGIQYSHICDICHAPNPPSPSTPHSPPAAPPSPAAHLPRSAPELLPPAPIPALLPGCSPSR